MTEPLILDKHLRKITVDDAKDVVILRPRYEKKADYIRRAKESIDLWKKQTGTNLNVLIVPHDWDVMVISPATGAVASCSEPTTESPSS